MLLASTQRTVETPFFLVWRTDRERPRGDEVTNTKRVLHGRQGPLRARRRDALTCVLPLRRTDLRLANQS